MGTQHNLATISLEMERQKRDAQSRQEQDRVGRLGGGLSSELGDSVVPGGAPRWRRGHGCALGKPPGWAGSFSPPLGVPIWGRWHGSALVSPLV